MFGIQFICVLNILYSDKITIRCIPINDLKNKKLTAFGIEANIKFVQFNKVVTKRKNKL